MSDAEIHLIAEIAAYVILVVAGWSVVMLIICLGRASDELGNPQSQDFNLWK